MTFVIPLLHHHRLLYRALSLLHRLDNDLNIINSMACLIVALVIMGFQCISANQSWRSISRIGQSEFICGSKLISSSPLISKEKPLIERERILKSKKRLHQLVSFPLFIYYLLLLLPCMCVLHC